jgi:hypothetical protein
MIDQHKMMKLTGFRLKINYHTIIPLILHAYLNDSFLYEYHYFYYVKISGTARCISTDLELKHKIKNKTIQLNERKNMNIYNIDELGYYSRRTSSCWKRFIFNC